MKYTKKDILLYRILNVVLCTASGLVILFWSKKVGYPLLAIFLFFLFRPFHDDEKAEKEVSGMGLFNALTHRSMAKEAKKLYAESKARTPNALESDIVFGMAFDPENFDMIPESSQKRIKICCETVQGFCYMIVLDTGKFKKYMNFRQLQFTKYMDDALVAEGFPPQSIQQKELILNAMKLNIDGWEQVTGD